MYNQKTIFWKRTKSIYHENLNFSHNSLLQAKHSSKAFRSLAGKLWAQLKQRCWNDAENSFYTVNVIGMKKLFNQHTIENCCNSSLFCRETQLEAWNSSISEQFASLMFARLLCDTKYHNETFFVCRQVIDLFAERFRCDVEKLQVEVLRQLTWEQSQTWRLLRLAARRCLINIYSQTFAARLNRAELFASCNRLHWVAGRWSCCCSPHIYNKITFAFRVKSHRKKLLGWRCEMKFPIQKPFPSFWISICSPKSITQVVVLAARGGMAVAFRMNLIFVSCAYLELHKYWKERSRIESIH